MPNSSDYSAGVYAQPLGAALTKILCRSYAERLSKVSISTTTSTTRLMPLRMRP
jgi:hypothetical protein